MDAHIALTISGYLSLHSSNVFFAMLGLTEHVIHPTTPLIPPSRQLEVIRCLGYPDDLIIASNNILAAIEKVANTGIVMDMLCNRFDIVGDYTATHPIAVAKIIDANYSGFASYIRSILPSVDMRYVDHIMKYYDDDVTAKYMSSPLPEWSINQHVINPTASRISETIKKVRGSHAMYKLLSIYGTPIRHVLTYTDTPMKLCPIHWRLFIVYESDYTDDDYLMIARATFADRNEVDDFLEQFTTATELCDKLREYGL